MFHQETNSTIKRRIISLSLVYEQHIHVKNRFLVSKETVVLRRWERSNNSLVVSNELIKVELPP